MGSRRPHGDLYGILEIWVLTPRGKEDVKGFWAGQWWIRFAWFNAHTGCSGENVERQARVHVGISLTGYCKSAGDRMLQAWLRVMPETMDENDEILEILGSKTIEWCGGGERLGQRCQGWLSFWRVQLEKQRSYSPRESKPWKWKWYGFSLPKFEFEVPLMGPKLEMSEKADGF